MRAKFELPYLTADTPGTGGVIKGSPEDFVVEERPLYEPEGEGGHLFLWIEKRGVSTFEVVRSLADICRVSPREIGFAGLKDAKSVARQYISVPNASEERVRAIDTGDFRVLDVKRHSRKLKTGHLRGNAFEITIRETAPGAQQAARSILDTLARRGVPNFYGPQRFGSGARNIVVGKAMLAERLKRAVQAIFAPSKSEAGTGVNEARGCAWRGEYNRSLALFPRNFIPERRAAIAMRQNGVEAGARGATSAQLARVLRAIPKRYLEFYVSAIQAFLFNEVVKRRFETLDTVLAGDLAWIHSKGVVFAVEDAGVEAPRAQAFEISPSGPIYGYKMPLARGAPGQVEREILANARLELRDFRMRIGLKNKGVRRPLRVPLADVSVESVENGVKVRFFLPKGAYATTVLREIIKPQGWEGLV